MKTRFLLEKCTYVWDINDSTSQLVPPQFQQPIIPFIPVEKYRLYIAPLHKNIVSDFSPQVQFTCRCTICLNPDQLLILHISMTSMTDCIILCNTVKATYTN
jgi:hypothetical protein